MHQVFQWLAPAGPLAPVVGAALVAAGVSLLVGAVLLRRRRPRIARVDLRVEDAPPPPTTVLLEEAAAAALQRTLDRLEQRLCEVESRVDRAMDGPRETRI